MYAPVAGSHRTFPPEHPRIDATPISSSRQGPGRGTGIRGSSLGNPRKLHEDFWKGGEGVYYSMYVHMYSNVGAFLGAVNDDGGKALGLACRMIVRMRTTYDDDGGS